MSGRRVLVTPLDWGLGHATRCIPIIRELQARGCEVFIGSSGDALSLLTTTFPSLRWFELSAYNPVYAASSSMVWKMAEQLTKFVVTIHREHRQTERIVRQEGIDLVISDNRYGCWSARARSFFMTHQVTILMPPGLAWLEGFISWLNRNRIRKFHQCWVPDWPQEDNLSGVLSKGPKLSLKYIGPLSRFSRPAGNTEKKFKIAVVLSGPEPQRSILEKLLQAQLLTMQVPALLVRGVPGNSRWRAEGNIQVVDFLHDEPLRLALAGSEIVVCRSGYSSVMDLAIMGGKAVFIPTPGQTEQEYLAMRFMKNGIAFCMPQQAIDLPHAIQQSAGFRGFTGSGYNHELLRAILDETLPAT